MRECLVCGKPDTDPKNAHLKRAYLCSDECKRTRNIERTVQQRAKDREEREKIYQNKDQPVDLTPYLTRGGVSTATGETHFSDR